jgi:hypothetical protein
MQIKKSKSLKTNIDMPIGELEFHPYLAIGAIPNASKLILGSFPVYECTDPDNEIKAQLRADEGTIRFFYGSARSSFWSLYSEHVDNQVVLPPDPIAILQSLAARRIAITDTIISSERLEYESSDTSLRSQELNVHGIRDLIEHGVTRILCTSKGVLKCLRDRIVSDPFGHIEVNSTLQFQSEFLNDINGAIGNLITPIAGAFVLANGQQVRALSIPSPGSPFRKLNDFGLAGNAAAYLHNYYERAFRWLLL